MRKILVGLVATAMVASICATATMAATNTNAWATDTLAANFNAATEIHSVQVDVDDTKTQESFTYFIVSPEEAETQEEVAEALAGIDFQNLTIDGRRYTLELAQSAQALDDLIATIEPASAIPVNTTIYLTLLDEDGDIIQLNGGNDAVYTFDFDINQNGTGGMIADIETSGSLDAIDIGDVIECDGQGNPIALTESYDGVDQDINDDDGVQSNKIVYFLVKKGNYSFDNDTYWKMKLGKNKNSKMIDYISDASEYFDGELIRVDNGQAMSNTNGRHRFIKVELAENYTDDEFKVGLDLTLFAESAATRVFDIKEDTSIKVKDFTFYIKNIVRSADNERKVGVNGLVLNPAKNDWNELTYIDEDKDVAFVKFFGDSDVDKFYAKLSTQWAHNDYSYYFNDQDAFYYEFTGSPNLSATSRADLQIYCPFHDENGKETIDPTTATIYQLIDGELIDVTSSFTYGEGDNGEKAFIARTRFLGSYIICEKPVKEAKNK